MKLITEVFDDITIQPLVEAANGKKTWIIEGVFAQAETKNRNGRIYPINILEREVERYKRDYIDTSRAIGELNHPTTLIPDPKSASHLTTSLIREGNDFIGKARVLNTPMGMTVQGLLEGGVKLGVSTRGGGTVSSKYGIDYVNEDYMFSCVDIVGNPSAPSAFVNGIMENTEFYFENGILMECDIEEYQKRIKKSKNLNEDMVNVFIDAMNRIRLR